MMTINKMIDLQTYDEKKMAKQIVIEEEKSKVIVFNFLPGQVMPKHGHPHKNAYVVVVEGEGTCHLDNIDSAVQQGDIIHCNPQQKISIENNGSTSMTVYVVHADE
ncbi:cupin domain-containing protein [Planococcus donghaensis]|uniref:cupin domain-containing protein n=2 Tax=Planococcus TaxID=1372 RepID=UPI0037366BCF